MRRLPWAALPVLLAACGGRALPPPPPDPDLVTLAENARTAFEAGVLDKAAALYRRALERARAMDDPGLIGTQAYNLAVCLLEEGAFDPAEAALAEAEAEMFRAGEDLADLLLLRAKLAFRSGDLAGAAARLEELAAHPGSRPGPAQRFEAALLRGRLELASDPRTALGARACLAEAEAQAGEAPAPERQAGLAGLSGRILALEGRLPEAAAAFDREAEALRRAGRFRELASALERAGRAHAAAGQRLQAGDRLYRAGRAFAAQGRLEAARAALAAASDAAGAAGESGLQGRIQALLEELVR